MKFGQIDIEKNKNVVFTLPDDTAITKKKFTIPKKNNDKNIYFGTSVWADPSFRGVLYPPRYPPSQYLCHYSTVFKTIELNSTFYGIPPTSRILNWKSKVNKGFMFCPKVPMSISHRKDIHTKKNLFDKFLDSILLFDDNLGVTFMQLPQYFQASDIENLLKFLEYIPKGMKFAVEFRHKSWIDENSNFNIYEILEKKNIISVITDTPGRRDILHMNVTADTTFIRFNGNNLHESDFTRIDEWIAKMDLWLNNGIKNIYFIIHQPLKSNSVKLHHYIKEKFRTMN